MDMVGRQAHRGEVLQTLFPVSLALEITERQMERVVTEFRGGSAASSRGQTRRRPGRVVSGRRPGCALVRAVMRKRATICRQVTRIAVGGNGGHCWSRGGTRLAMWTVLDEQGRAWGGSWFPFRHGGVCVGCSSALVQHGCEWYPGSGHVAARRCSLTRPHRASG